MCNNDNVCNINENDVCNVNSNNINNINNNNNMKIMVIIIIMKIIII